MTINELLGKPVWQMTGEELLFLTQHGKMSTSGETAKASSKEEKRYVYGLAGIARLFGCSLPTANRMERPLCFDPFGQTGLLTLAIILLPLVKSWCRGQFYFTLLDTLAFLSPQLTHAFAI